MKFQTLRKKYCRVLWSPDVDIEDDDDEVAAVFEKVPWTMAI